MDVLAELARLLAEGVLKPVLDDWEFAVTEVVAPGIEIGLARMKSAVCRYPAHRPRDRVTPDGRPVCVICHPPASAPGGGGMKLLGGLARLNNVHAAAP